MCTPATLKPTFALREDFDNLGDDAEAMSEFNLGIQNMRAWDSPHVRDLFAQKHYWLDEFRKVDDTECFAAFPPSHPPSMASGPLDSKEAPETALVNIDIDPYPYTRDCPATPADGEGVLLCLVLGGKDIQGRPIIAKVFDSKRGEGAIYRHLLREDPSVLKDNCILPILDIIDFDDRVSFAVMPKWHCLEGQPRFGPKTVGDMFTMIHSLLKGMAYLHRNRIVHLDIRADNLVCNFGTSLSADDSVLHQLREARRLRLAYIDFDLSVIYPPETDLANARLPRNYAATNYEGEPTPELQQGQSEFNPFALEVARLGYLFLRVFRYGIEDIPTLAPLISMMTDWDLSRRFTAEEALSFCEEHCAPRANEDWDKDLRKSPVLFERMEKATLAEWWSPWYLTESSFAEEWASYRPRPTGDPISSNDEEGLPAKM